MPTWVKSTKKQLVLELWKIYKPLGRSKKSIVEASGLPLKDGMRMINTYESKNFDGGYWRAFFESGLSDYDISRITEYSYAAVSKYRRKLGYHRPAGGDRTSLPDIDKVHIKDICELYLNGSSVDSIKRKYPFYSYTKISDALKQNLKSDKLGPKVRKRVLRERAQKGETQYDI